MTKAAAHETVLVIGVLSLEGSDEGCLWDVFEEAARDGQIPKPAFVSFLRKTMFDIMLAPDISQEQAAKNVRTLVLCDWETLAGLIWKVAHLEGARYHAYRALLLSRDPAQARFFLHV